MRSEAICAAVRPKLLRVRQNGEAGSQYNRRQMLPAYDLDAGQEWQLLIPLEPSEAPGWWAFWRLTEN